MGGHGDIVDRVSSRSDYTWVLGTWTWRLHRFSDADEGRKLTSQFVMVHPHLVFHDHREATLATIPRLTGSQHDVSP